MDKNNPYALHIYTDGSSYSHPRRGGFGMLFIFPEEANRGPEEICPYGYQKATNNQMELKACCIALLESMKFERKWQNIVIHTDSQYVVDNYQRAIYQWSKNKWEKNSGAPVLNMELWKELIKNIDKVGVKVEIAWIEGHSKDKNNNRVDQLAKISSSKANNPPIFNVNIRRRMSDKKTQIGSVKMLGQKISIRIITSQRLKQKIGKYKFEVVSKRSPFFKNVDEIYSQETLRVGHEYCVRFNKDQKFPQIVNIYIDMTEEKRQKINN